jgi:hypothetical protein
VTGDADDPAVEATRRWVDEVVIGLNLCPFARKPAAAGRVRYAITAAADPDALLAALAGELRALVAAPRSEVETTLLVHPRALPDFLDYNDFLTDADALVRRLGLRGVVQIAGFHPHWQFAGTAPDAVENYTNRSPHPMLHLLREESVSEVNADPDALMSVPERNIDLLRSLGRAEVLRRWRVADPGER